MCELRDTMATARSLLIVLDGFGIGKDSPFNAINNAHMPFYREVLRKYPHSQLITHGEAVGLPGGVMGNSEVGHMTMGAGRVVYQDLTRISKSIEDRSFFSNPVLRATLLAGAKAGGRVHLMGLLSDGGVHSHLDHLLALLDLCVELEVPRVSVHAFLDGRDTSPVSSIGYLKRLLEHPAFAPAGAKGTRATIATLTGRYWAMDRDRRWERVSRAYAALTGQSSGLAPEPQSTEPAAIRAVRKSHENGKTDEFVEPVLLDPSAAMKSGDSVVFFNYRADRAREITQAFTFEEFTDFDRGPGRFRPSAYAGLTVYDKRFAIPAAFGPQDLTNIFAEWLEKKKLKQFRLAETEKYAHVTFFFNGGREAPYAGEERLLIPSPRDCATYDEKPEMSAFQIADAAAERLLTKNYDFMLMNFANADMVGHTGNYDAAVRAMEALDQCLEKVIGTAERSGYNVLVTADHGNAEEMRACDGHPHTQHTLNPVPAVWIEPGTANGPKSSRRALRDGTLEDVMPTLCGMMGLDTPREATGNNLIPPT